MENKAYPFEHGLSPVTAKLIDRLKRGCVDNIITDEELLQCCGRSCNPGGEGYGNLASAIKRVESEQRLVWRRVRDGDCIKCLSPEETISVIESAARHINRHSKRAVRTGNTICLEGLDEEKKAKALVTMAQLGTMALLGSRQTHQKLLGRNITEPVDSHHLLEIFPKKK